MVVLGQGRAALGLLESLALLVEIEGVVLPGLVEVGGEAVVAEFEGASAADPGRSEAAPAALVHLLRRGLLRARRFLGRREKRSG